VPELRFSVVPAAIVPTFDAAVPVRVTVFPDVVVRVEVRVGARGAGAYVAGAGDFAAPVAGTSVSAGFAPVS